MSNEEENDERIPEEGASQIHARNMEQLLQSTIAMQSYPDASEAQNVVAGMNSQDAKWLSEAIGGIFSDPSEEMRARMVHVKRLLDTSPASEEKLDVIGELGDQLEEFIQDVDLANDFAKSGGLDLIKICLDRDESQLRSLGCRLASEMAQNNEYGMEQIVKHPSIFGSLLSIVKNEQEESKVRTAAFSAISGAVRDSDVARREFLSKSSAGPQLLMLALKSDIEKLQTKAAFLLQSTAEWPQQQWHEQLLSMGVVTALSDLYKNGERNTGNILHEMTLKSIVMLLNVNKARTVEELKNNQNDMKNTLNEGLEFMEVQHYRDAYQEEWVCACQILELLQTDV
ncbi:uncharacterized protein LOC142335883 [Convolutriloba macropyga]|uniref:uncharacterized protein LOC142335883 n=1 Tax=Convolutriloba macropyga TaxID=536237 RepID=UPI003F521C04